MTSPTQALLVVHDALSRAGFAGRGTMGGKTGGRKLAHLIVTCDLAAARPARTDLGPSIPRTSDLRAFAVGFRCRHTIYGALLSRNPEDGPWLSPEDPGNRDVGNSGQTHRHSTVRRPLRRIRRSLPAFPPSRQAFPQERLTTIMEEGREAWRGARRENAKGEWKEQVTGRGRADFSTLSVANPYARHSARRSANLSARLRPGMPKRRGVYRATPSRYRP